MKSTLFIIIICLYVGNVFAGWAWPSDPYSTGDKVGKILVKIENNETILMFKYVPYFPDNPDYGSWYYYECTGQLDDNGITFLTLLTTAKISDQEVNVYYDYDAVNDKAIIKEILVIE